jgi:hypothetical protein
MHSFIGQVIGKCRACWLFLLHFEIHLRSLFSSLCSIIMVLSFIVKDKWWYTASTCFLSCKYLVTFYALLLNDVKCQHNA